MQRPSPAAQRFYDTFLRWTILTSSRPACRHRARRALSLSAGRRQEAAPDGDLEHVVIRKHVATPRLGSTSHDPSLVIRRFQPRFHVENDAQTSAHDPLVDDLRNAPVTSSAEKPFTSMQRPWQVAVRYRSANAIMLEYAVPERRVREMQSKYNERLKRLADDSGARIELGSAMRTDKGEELRSVLVSGSMDAARKVDELFKSFATGLRDTYHKIDVAPAECRGVEMRSVRLSGVSDAVGPVQSEESRSSKINMPDDDAARSCSDENSAIENRYRKWRVMPVQTEIDLPIHNISTRKTIVRSRSDKDIVIEVALSGNDVAHLRSVHGRSLQRLKLRYRSTMNFKHVEVTNAPSNDPDAIAMSIMMSGSFSRVNRALEAVHKSLVVLNQDVTWLSRPVETPAQVPSSSIKHRSYVIRERDEEKHTALVELALRDETYERALAGDFLADESGVKVEATGSAREEQIKGELVILRTVLLAGTYDQLQLARKLTKTLDETLDEIRREASVSHPKTVGVTASETKSALSESPSGEIEVAEKMPLQAAKTAPNTPRIAAGPVKSQEAWSSEELGLWESVVRRRSEDGKDCVAEIRLPESVWQSIRAKRVSPERRYKLRYDVAIEAGEVLETPADRAGGFAEVEGRSLLIRGLLDNVARALDAVRSNKGQWLKNGERADSTLPVTKSHKVGRGVSSVHESRPSASSKTFATPPMNPTEARPSNDTFTERIRLPAALASIVIGRGGEMQQTLTEFSGVEEIIVAAAPTQDMRVLKLRGSRNSVRLARRCIDELVARVDESDQTNMVVESEAAPSTFYSHARLPGTHDWQRRKVAAFISGPDNQFLKLMMRLSGASISQDTDTVGGLVFTGSWSAITSVKALINGRLATKEESTGTVEEVMAGELKEGAGLPLPDPPPARTDTKWDMADGDEMLDDDDVAALTRPERLTDDVRTVLRSLTHPVVLITSRRALSRDERNNLDIAAKAARGVTVSSFNTVSLQPFPIISFNLKLPSRTWDAMASSRRMCVHILSATPAAAAITHAFTLPHDRPEEPFLLLRRMDAHVHHNKSSPRIVHDEAVLARLTASILPEKLTRVGDHVVVFARVIDVGLGDLESKPSEHVRRVFDDAVGLAYAQRGYRGIGPSIEVPSLPEAGGSNTSHDRNAAAVHGVTNMLLSKEEQTGTFTSKYSDNTKSESPGTPRRAEDAEFNYFRSNSEYSEPDAPDFSPVANLRREAVVAEEDDYDFGFGSQDQDDSRLGGSGHAHNSDNTLPERQITASQDDGVWHSSLSAEVGSVLAQAKRASRPRSWHRHNYSTVARLSSGVARPYSTATAAPSPVHEGIPNDRHSDTTALVTDRSLLSQTISDFLGESSEPIHQSRMRALLKSKNTAERASRQLEQALADGTLTEEQSLKLEHTITTNERRVAKALALRSADDLRRMLDTGKVDVRRAQWMESSVEKGMVVVVDEARQVRGMFDRGEIDERTFGLVKEKLEMQHSTLNTEAMRLRGMVDEDDEGAYGAPLQTDTAENAEQTDGRFDGFRGNV